MSDRVVLVTGSTDGIGRQTARELAARGLRVIVHGRSMAKVDATVAALREELPGGTFDAIAFDLGRMSEVRRGADRVLALAPELHVLVNNAGIFAPERAITADGIELTLAVNYVGPWLLTELLTPRLLDSAKGDGPASRVLNISSIAHGRGTIHFEDIHLVNGFTPYAAYAQSKLAQVMHALTLAERHDPSKLVAYSIHPGTIATKLLRQGFGPIAGRGVEAGASGPVRIASAVTCEDPSGSYYSDGVATPPASAAREPDSRQRLWDLTDRLASP